jgi:hypothetical protein
LLAGGSVLAIQGAPSDEINLGVIVNGGRGTFVMTLFQNDLALRVMSLPYAMPEHWHAQRHLRGVTSMPHTEEGVQLTETESHTRQIVRVGMQRRGYDLYLDGAKLAKET